MEAGLYHGQDQISLLGPQASKNLPLNGFNGVMRSARQAFVLGGVICASLASLPAFASTLYSQTPSSFLNPMDSSTGNGWLYNYFIATQSGAVSNITWQGDAQPVINSGFTISILSGLIDSAVLPELSTVKPLMTSTVPGNANQTDGPVGTNTLPLYYNFTMDLPTPFNLVKNTGYWINIESNGSTLWSWAASGTGGSSNIQYCDANSYSCNPGSRDRAFSLNGTLVTAVPTPVAVWLFGSGLMGLLSLSHRKKTANF